MESLPIEDLALSGRLGELKVQLQAGYEQKTIDKALGLAIAYAQLAVAEYLISLGADITYDKYDGVYYAVHNSQLEGLKFAIAKGVDINVQNGLLLNTAVMSATNTGNTDILTWMLRNGADTQLISPDMLAVARRFGSEQLKRLLNL